MITLDRLKQILHYDPETGVWTWLIKPSRRLAQGSVAGTIKQDGYRQIIFAGQHYYSAVLAWFYMTGEWPTNLVDHENRNRSDDRWLNLREATYSDNGANRKMQSNNTSGYRGVSWDQVSGKWDVRVNRIHIGFYSDLAEAVSVRDACALSMQGSFATPNTIHGELT